MAAFVSARQSIPNATATRIVDAADLDRTVYVNGLGTVYRVAFTSGAVSTGAALTSLAGSGAPAVFVLPADEDLWVYQTGGSTVDVDFLVTLVK